MHNSKTQALGMTLHAKQAEAQLKRMNHGSPYDRVSADSYYMRAKKPHYYPNGTYENPLILEEFMTTGQVQDYNDGYNDNEKDGHFKDWG